MPKKSRPTFQKREKERARQQKRKDKQARRFEAKNRTGEQASQDEDLLQSGAPLEGGSVHGSDTLETDSPHEG